jgi:hypothetical protein
VAALVALAGVAVAAITTIDRPATVSEVAVRVGQPSPSGVVYSSNFFGPNGSPWPSPWRALNRAVISATLVGNAARLTGETGHVARMALPIAPVVDADVSFSIRFDAYTSQGFGFYVRQNGGALRDTPLHGQGYAVFVEGGYQRVVGIWKEIDGVETRIGASPPYSADLADGVWYRVRFRVEQAGAATSIRAKVWPVGQAEPSAWAVDVIDSTPQLQNTAGAFAADVYNYSGTGGVDLDDLVITAI